MAPASPRPADASGRHGTPRPQRPLSPRDRLRDLGLVVIERGVAAAPDDRATVHPVHRARRDRGPDRLRQANLLTAAPLSPPGAVRAAGTYTAASMGGRPIGIARLPYCLRWPKRRT